MALQQTSYSLANFSVLPRGRLQSPYAQIQHYDASVVQTANLTIGATNFALLAQGLFVFLNGANTLTLPAAVATATTLQIYEFLSSNKRNFETGDITVLEIINPQVGGAVNVSVTQTGGATRTISYNDLCGCVALQWTVTKNAFGVVTAAYFTLL